MSASPARFAGCTLALIGGGRARRLGGRDKSALRLPDGRTVLARLLEELGPACDAMLLVGDGLSAPRPEVETVSDRIADRGAPGGVLTACAVARTPWVLAVAIDMPFVSPAALAALWEARADVDVVVPVREGRVEPLHAFYRAAACAPAFEPLLRDGGRSFVALYEGVRTRRIEAATLHAVDPGLRSMLDVDTAEDAERLGVHLSD